MNTNLFHIYEKFTGTDDQFQPQGGLLTMYRYKFSMLDRDHAIHVCSNDDGRYVFTVETAFHNVNG